MAISQVATLAPVLEAFASIQGEGLYVGTPQVFLRLAGCPLRCLWCDTPGSWDFPEEPRTRIEPSAEAGGRRIEEGSATPLRAAAWIAELDPSGRRALSVTGGEPLMHPAFIRGLRPLLGERRLHLETGGGHPETLESLLDVIDHVSLDLKPPGDMGPPVDQGTLHEASPRDAREWDLARAICLRLVRQRDACGKIVISAGASEPYLSLLEDVADLAPELPLFLQPVSPMGGFEAPSRSLLEELVEAGLERELDVHVVPQVHRFLRLP
ncbi:MAG: 7-carboxy-7-deazaguanine synthase [Planctomycetota bacterium]|jgi:7-carboxy-7-deazaguanine synthase